MMSKMLSIIFFLALFVSLTFSATVSLVEQSDYTSQRPCAQACFYLGAFSGPDALADGIGCDVHTITNDCFCRADLQASADSLIKRCVNSRCSSNTLDTNSALSVYDGYCTSAGYTKAVEATTTDAGTPISPATVTVTAVRTETVTAGGARLRSPVEVVVQLVGLRR
jgi:hypothetical protein